MHAISRLLAVLGRLNDAVCLTGRSIAAAFLMAMLAIVLIQVVFRYGLNDSLSWTEEVAKVMMVWLTLLVAPWAYRSGAQIRVTLFRDVFPDTLRRIVDVAIPTLVLWIVGVLFLESIDLWRRGLDAMASTVPVPTAVFYSILPIGFLALMLVALEHLLMALLAFQDGTGETGPGDVVPGQAGQGD